MHEGVRPLIDIVIATHGTLSKAFQETAVLIAGEISHMSYLGFYHGDDVDVLEKKIAAKIDSALAQNKQVLVLVDLLGGSPSNRSAMVLNNLDTRISDVEVVVGVNLPMVLEAALNVSTVKDVQELKSQVMQVGQAGIVDLKEQFNLNGVMDE